MCFKCPVFLFGQSAVNPPECCLKTVSRLLVWNIWGPQLGPGDGGAPLCYHSDGLSLSAVSPAFHPQNHGELNDSRSYHGDELVSVLLGPLMEAVSGSNLQGTGKL